MMPLIASYRLQLSKDFTFHDAASRVPYLRRLGVSHVYLSPVMECLTGSNHGYDATDLYALSAERGGQQGYDALVAALGDDMRLIVDIVPNHMSASVQNRQWRDVLLQGNKSPYWSFFDLYPDQKGQIVLPVLADEPQVLWDSGEIYLQNKNDKWVLRYGEMDFPLRPETGPSDDYNKLMRQQHYRLEKCTHDTYTYRRFFHLKEMVALRVEDPDAAAQAHAVLFRLLDTTDAIDGLRIDHIDGLAVPMDYLNWLAGKEKYIWVEKILARGESLPDWSIMGTTGYEFIDALNMLMINHTGYQVIEKWWRKEIEPAWPDFDACLYQAKKEAIENLFSAVFRKLAADFCDEETEEEQAYDFLTMLTAALPVYRVYGRTQQDLETLSSAIKAAKADSRFDHLQQKFMPRFLSEKYADIYRTWQQISGGVMAKGLEDCAHYRYTPLAALNEVGCIPAPPADGRKAFADFINVRAAQQPCGMNSSSTHDTKRSEDVRARLYALADNPASWIAFYDRCRAISLPDDIPAVTFHFFLQAACGSWPSAGGVTPEYIQRLQDYMEKSAREERRFAGYDDASEAYIHKLRRFVKDMLRHPDFQREMTAFMQDLAPAGALNSLAAMALKCLSPGMPDIYQGCDLWDFSLVDPDNRREVDYNMREEMLNVFVKNTADHNTLSQLCRDWKNGAVKLWLLQRLLGVRRRFMAGQAVRVAPVSVRGASTDNIHACLFYTNEHAFLLVHALYPARLGKLRDGIGLPQDFCEGVHIILPDDIEDADGMDVVTGVPITVAEVGQAMMRFPIAVLQFPHAEPSYTQSVG